VAPYLDKTFLDSVPDGVVVVDARGRILAANDALAQLLGYEVGELEGRDVDMLLPEGLREAHARHRAAYVETPRRRPMGTGLELTALRKDGSELPAEISLAPHETPEGVVVVAALRDIAERVEAEHVRRHLEARLQQIQKMEALGRLAGGVAHDFNNALTVIVGYADMIVSRRGLDADTLRDVREIQRAAEHAGGLVRQLLTFGRRRPLEARIIDCGEVVTGVADMLRRLIGEQVELVVETPPGLWRVRADPVGLEQVIINLAVNGRDAMPGGGVLRIEVANREVDDESVLRPDAEPGRYVVLSVSDTGMGMDEATRSRIFEPYFTTKEPGAGTGLGLATVFGIVRQSGGTIVCRSEPGRGTTFHVCLPRAEITSPTEGEGPDHADWPAGTETVLLVEDDDLVRSLAGRVLERSGYTVVAAAGAAAAIEAVRGRLDSIDLLLTDVVMPGMSGRELATLLLAERPGLRVMYMSGYAPDAIHGEAMSRLGEVFLEKPFTPLGLARAVRATLDVERDRTPV
jgi:hypothetical protein